LVVATTRPETMLGDAAVAIHPNDDRYKHLLGEFVELPLTGRRIPIIADEYVDPEFGTAASRLHRPMILMITKSGHVTATPRYSGFTARRLD